MRCHWTPVALLLGALFSPLHAQDVSRGTDPISGTWVGDMGPDASSRMRVNIELEFDGISFSGLLTSPGLAPGDIAGGTYDARTGAVNFVVAVRGGDTKVRFTGTLERDTIAGRVSLPNMAGTFQIARAATGATPARPAEPASDAARTAVRAGFAQVNALVFRAMATVPAEKYGYRPVATARTFGQVVAHIVDSYQFYCRSAVRGAEVQRSDAVERGPTDRGTLMQRLRFAIDICNGANSEGDLGPLIENIANANLHYGSLVMYIRLLGLTSPGS